MQEIASIIWQWIDSVLGGLAGAGIGFVAVRGWFWLGRNKESQRDGAHAGTLSVVRAIAGPASNELGLILSDRVKAWRMNNLIRVSEKFDRICDEKGLNRHDLQSLTIAVGLPMLERASYEEDDELQEMWANLMVSATSNTDPSEDSKDLYRTWVNILSQMSRWDCRLLSAVIEEGISGMEEGVMLSSPLSDEDVREVADMPRIRVDIHLQKLASLGLVYRDPKTPLETGGPTGLQYAYTPTHLGMNMYMACGNVPKWFEGQVSLPSGQ